MEQFTVSLDEFTEYLKRKWVVGMLCVILSVIAFVVAAVLLENEIVIPPNEKYDDLKAEEASYEQYIENAPLMKIDPNNVHQRIIYLSNITEKDLLKNFVESGNVWNDWEDEVFRYYFFDHVTWYDSGIKSAEIKIQYYEEQECQRLAEYLKDKIIEYDNSVSALLGDEHISNDEEIAEVQIWYVNRLDDVQGQLEYTASGYVIETNLSLMIIAGVIAGTLVAITGLFIAFLSTMKKQNACE